jgi:hypothetical protein
MKPGLVVMVREHNCQLLSSAVLLTLCLESEGTISLCSPCILGFVYEFGPTVKVVT